MDRVPARQHWGMGGLRELVVARGRACGLDAVGIASASPFERTLGDLLSRKEAGHSADMQFTYRNPQRSTDPSMTLSGARSLVVGAVRYASESAGADSAVDARGIDPDVAHGPGDGSDADRPRPSGRVARYAIGPHDEVLRSALGALAEDLRLAGYRAVVLADDNALVDRAAAHRAGLGWFGRSANFLLPGRGSWFVLGSVLTDAELQPAPDVVPDGCGTCRRCIDACPTGAIVDDGVVDARRCLSWLLQSPGTFPHEHRVALGDRIYGCDDCQEVCPPNRLADRRGEGVAVALDGSSGSGVDAGRVDLLQMLDADDGSLLEMAGRWYVPDRDPQHLRRNVLLVLGNTADGTDPEVASRLRRYLCGDDPNLASHAAWAALRLGRRDLLEDEGVAGRSWIRDEMERWDRSIVGSSAG